MDAQVVLWDTLPPELQTMVICFVPCPSLLPCFLVAKSWAKLMNSNLLWQARLRGDFNKTSIIPNTGEEWKELYKRLLAQNTLKWDIRYADPVFVFSEENRKVTRPSVTGSFPKAIALPPIRTTVSHTLTLKPTGPFMLGLYASPSVDTLHEELNERGHWKDTLGIFNGREGEAILMLSGKSFVHRKGYAPQSREEHCTTSYVKEGGRKKKEEKNIVKIYIDATKQTATFHSAGRRVEIPLPKPSPIFLVYSNSNPYAMEILHKEL